VALEVFVFLVLGLLLGAVDGRGLPVAVPPERLPRKGGAIVEDSWRSGAPRRDTRSVLGNDNRMDCDDN
jgi:hypothetical protein